MADENIAYMKYFTYSLTQHKLKEELALRSGRKYIPGSVIFKGSDRKYTELTKKPNMLQFPDTEIICYLDVRTASFIEPKNQ